MSTDAFKTKILNYLLDNVLPLLPPYQQAIILVILLLILSIFGYCTYRLFLAGAGWIGRKQKSSGHGPNYYDATALCGILAKDLAIAAYSRAKGELNRIPVLARRALVQGVVGFLGSRGGENVRACILVRSGPNLIIEEGVGYSAEAHEKLALPISETIAGDAYTTRTTQYCRDITKDRSFKENPKRRRNYRSLLCIPIYCADETYGVLNIDAIPVGSFTDKEVKALEAFAWIASLSFVIERSVNGYGAACDQKQSAGSSASA